MFRGKQKRTLIAVIIKWHRKYLLLILIYFLDLKTIVSDIVMNMYIIFEEQKRENSLLCMAKWARQMKREKHDRPDIPT